MIIRTYIEIVNHKLYLFFNHWQDKAVVVLNIPIMIQ